MKKVVPVLLSLILAVACSTSPDSKRAGYGKRGYAKQKSQRVQKKQTGYVKRATFTTAVVNREPKDQRSEFRNDQQRIYYFTDLRGMQGQQIVHRWMYKGKVMAEVPFKVKGPRWRVNSSKWLQREWLGTWTVSVVDRAGRILSKDSFTYAKAGGSWFSVGDLPASAAPEPADSGDAGESYIDRTTRGVIDLYQDMFGDE